MMRLDKYLCETGFGTRSQVKALLKKGLVQVDGETVKEGFDRVLKAVQETARAQVARLKGQTLDALAEEVNEQDPSLITGRLSNNTIVHFPGDPSLVGSIVNVRLEECRGFYYTGSLAD